MPQSNPLTLAILGPSGTGKGTHATGLCSRFRLRHVATGDLFRENLLTRTALGILARKHLDAGELVPDEVVDAMIEEWFDRLPTDRGALIDGFPRTVCQADFLDELLARAERQLDAVIYLQVGDAEIAARLAGRYICRSCQEPYHLEKKPPQVYGVCDECGGELYHRPDDSSDRVAARLRVFHRATGPVLERYAAAGKLIVVSGEGAIADVDDHLVRAIESVRNRTYVFPTAEEVADIMRHPGPPILPSHRVRPTVDIVLLGAPGSGKGTQAGRLADALQLPHIATGDLFRENLRQATELGRLAQSYMDRGELVPDDVTDAMVEERLARPDATDGFILDGFPRTLPQAHALQEILARQHRRLAGVVYIQVSDDALTMRLSARLVCRDCQTTYHPFFNAPRREGVCDRCGGPLQRRSDDEPKTVAARLATYRRQTEPLIGFYREAGLLHEVSGEDDLDAITPRLLAEIHSFAPAMELVRHVSLK